MKITFLGAAHQVTGSCFMIEACGKKLLVDCGMEQGPQIYEQQSLPVPAAEIDFVLLTHAHIDHSGKLPLLGAQGFKGEIYCTQATRRLCNIMLKDSAYIQERETEWKNRKAQRTDGNMLEPLYTLKDAEETLKLFKTHEFRESFNLAEGLRVRFLDAGHLLGSAFVEITISENGITKTVLFTGDIGNKDMPLLNDPCKISYADYIIMESTYGDKDHTPYADPVTSLADLIQDAFDLGGKLIIPAFAVGRTQELLYYIREIKLRSLVKGYGNFTVYLDSPLAIEATSIFESINPIYYDEEAAKILKRKDNPVGFPGLKLSVSQEESVAINLDDSPCVIISASGMCEAGRIRHHLKHNLWKKQNTILFSGYQVEGTLGRTLLNGAKKVKLFGEEVNVHARIIKLDGFSAHADRTGLLNWIKNFETPPKKVFLVHGEDTVCEQFAATLRNELNLDAVSPFYMEEHDLALGIKVKNGTRILREAPQQAPAPSKVRSAKYNELLESVKRLQKLVDGADGWANYELAKFAKQLDDLTKKFS